MFCVCSSKMQVDWVKEGYPCNFYFSLVLCLTQQRHSNHALKCTDMCLFLLWVWGQRKQWWRDRGVHENTGGILFHVRSGIWETGTLELMHIRLHQGRSCVASHICMSDPEISNKLIFMVCLRIPPKNTMSISLRSILSMILIMNCMFRSMWLVCAAPKTGTKGWGILTLLFCTSNNWQHCSWTLSITEVICHHL